MMNTLRRKSFLRQNSRPSLISFNKHDACHFKDPSQECEPLRNIHNTQNAHYNVPQHDYNHQFYKNVPKKKSKYGNRDQKHYRSHDREPSDNGGFPVSKRHTKYSTVLEPENHHHSHYSPRTPYDRHDVPFDNNNSGGGNLFNSRNSRDYDNYDNHNDSRYDQEQRHLSRNSYHHAMNTETDHRQAIITTPSTADSGYDIRKSEERKDDQRKRSTSLLKKQTSFRQYLGYPVTSNSASTNSTGTSGTNAGAVQQTGSAAASVPSISRSVGGVVKRRKHVVLLGLDGAGKTTILMRLKYRCFVATTPTVGFNHEKVWGGGFRWSAWDVGGGERLRPLWGTYTRATDGIVFVVNSAANEDTVEESRLELARILKLSKTTALQMGRASPPLLVLANFQDLRQARNAPELAKSLCLPQEGHSAYSNRSVVTSTWAVVCVSGITGEGLDDALNTLRQLMDQGGAHNHKSKNRVLDRWR